MTSHWIGTLFTVLIVMTLCSVEVNGRGGGRGGGGRSGGTSGRSGRSSYGGSTGRSTGRYTGSTGSRRSSSYISYVPSVRHTRVYVSVRGYYYSYYNMYFYHSGTYLYVSRPRPSSNSFVCANYEANANGTTMGVFKCPNPWEPDNFRYCCGENYAEYCCKEKPNNAGRIAGIVIGTLIGVVILIVAIVCCVKCCSCCSKSDVTTSRTVVTTTTTSGNMQPSYPAQGIHNVSYEGDNYAPPSYDYANNAKYTPGYGDAPPNAQGQGYDGVTPNGQAAPPYYAAQNYPSKAGDAPSEGGAPYPPVGNEGGAPYLPAGNLGGAPYPPAGNEGGAPYPPSGNEGGAPYPPTGNQGGAPYPPTGNQGGAPYPPAGNTGNAPYPTDQSALPYPTQPNTALYPDNPNTGVTGTSV